MKHYDHYITNKGYCMLLHEIEETTYDENNNPIQTIIGNGYYKNGLIELDKENFKQIIYRTYDKNNKLIKIIEKNYCMKNLMTTYTTNIYYDNNDNIKLIQTSTNRFTIIDYDDNNNIIKVISHYDPYDIIKCDLFNKKYKTPIKNIHTIPALDYELKTLKLQYDKNNNCVEENYNNGEMTTRYIYNNDGKLIAENIFEYDEIISERTIIIDDNFNIENFTDHKDSDNSYRNIKSKNTNIEMRDKNGDVISIKKYDYYNRLIKEYYNYPKWTKNKNIEYRYYNNKLSKKIIYYVNNNLADESDEKYSEYFYEYDKSGNQTRVLIYNRSSYNIDDYI